MSELAIYGSSTREVAEKESKYIVFKVGREIYGIDVSYVDTIIQMPMITKVPAAPGYFKGIINLRGEIIPIMSLSQRLNNTEDVISQKSSIIVLDLGDGKMMGVTIDDVKEVMTLADSEIEEPSPFLKKETSFIKGVAKKDENLISIIEIFVLANREIA